MKTKPWLRLVAALSATGLSSILDLSYCLGSPIGSTDIHVKIISSDNNRQERLIAVSKAEIAVYAAFKGTQILTLEIRKLSKEGSVKIQYGKKNSGYHFQYGYATSDTVFYGTENCGLRSNAVSGAEELDQFLTAKATSALENQCYSHAKVPDIFKPALEKLSTDQEGLGICLRKVDLEASIAWSEMPDSLENTEICVTKDDPQLNLCKGETKIMPPIEDSLSRIQVGTTCLLNQPTLYEILKHELLHSAGIIDENVLKCVASECPDSSKVQKCVALEKNLPSSSLSPTKDDVTIQVTATSSANNPNAPAAPTPQAAKAIAQTQTVQVPRTISTTAVPAVPADYARGPSRSFTVPAGGSGFAQNMMSLANSLLGATPALASAAEVPSSSRRVLTRKNSPRQPKQNFPTKVPKTNFPSTSAPDSPADSSNVSSAPTTNSPSEPKKYQDVATTYKNTSDKNKSNSVGTKNSILAAQASGGTSAKSSKSSPQSDNRMPASQTSGSGNEDCQALSEQKVLARLNSESPQGLRKLLQSTDSNSRCLLQSLANNCLTIYDANGNTFGLSESEKNRRIKTYSFTGDRIVLQKVFNNRRCQR